MNYLIMLFILSIACLLWIIGNSFRGPLYNSVKDSYELDPEGDITGSYFIIAALLLIFIAGTLI